MNVILPLPEAQKPSNKKFIVVVAIIAIAMISIILFWLFTQKSISSSHAQVEGYTFPLSSPINGRVLAVHVKEGQEVPYGALLVSMDESPLQVALQDALANLELALRGKAPQLGLDPDSARVFEELSAQIENYRSTAKSSQQILEHWTAEHARAMLVLRSAGQSETARNTAINEEAYARTQMEQARTALDQATRQRAEADVKLQRMRQNYNASLSPQRQVEVWRARVAQAQADLANAGIHAPDNGIINHVSVMDGQHVTAGQPLLTLSAGGAVQGGIWVTALFDSNALKLHVGQECKVKLENGTTIRGSIATVIPEGKAYMVKVALDSADIPAGIVPGQRATVSARPL